MSINMNTLSIEWTDDGAVAMASGFEGVMLTCPRCKELLPRDVANKCGDRVTKPKPKKAGQR